MFAGMIGMPTTSIGGSTNSSVAQSPNVDFYVLLDNSPSMALPQSADGITQMNSYTGCALACHQAVPDSETAKNLYWNPSSPSQACPKSTTPGCVQMDNYQMARHYNIPLRIDNLAAGMTALLGDADTNRAALAKLGTTPPNYSFTVNSIDSQYAAGFTSLMPKTVNTYSTAWATAGQGLQLMEMYTNNNICVASGSNPCAKPGGGGDAETNYDDSLSKQLAQMATPGKGTNNPGDTPQGVLFFVTDGVEDEMDPTTGQRLEQPINWGNGTNYCTQIKAKGIQIAILYTTYLPLTTDAWYEGHIAQYQNNIAPNLQACASPGLFLQAQVGEDLGLALQQLFTLTTKAVHLSAN